MNGRVHISVYFVKKILPPVNRYASTVKDLLPNTVSQKNEKQHISGLDDTAIPFIKIKTSEIPHEKKLNTAKS